MPFTAFHFGPGTLLKALASRYVSLTAFVTSQVIIDLESGYHLLRGDWPVHRAAHTLPLGAVIGILSGTAVWVAGRWIRASEVAEIQAELEPLPAHVGGVVGGLSHPLLDGIMHADVQPFWPITTANPLLEVLELTRLHYLCLAAGVVGILLLALRVLMAKG
jgi:hypothetical protein